MANIEHNVASQQNKSVSLDKHDSGNTDFEVAEPMHMTNSGDPTDERPGVNEKKPIIEKHITKIPQSEGSSGGDGSAGTHKENLKEKVKKHLPGHHNSENTNDTQEDAVNFSRQDSGSSDFEVAGFMPMTTQGFESTSETSNKKPRLERQISSIPEKDDDIDGKEEEGMTGKLRRKISHIAQND